MRLPYLTVVAMAASVLRVGANVPSDVPVAFDRYQVILDREPFGSLPPPSSQVTTVPQAESFAKRLRLSTIIDQDDGSVTVGFIETGSNRSYMLREGESEDGIEVVSASWADEEAVLKQGQEMAVIRFVSGDVQAITPEQHQQQQQSSRPSFIERRRQRQAEMQKQLDEPPPQPKYTGDELTKHLQNYQMDVIRQGLPPLPIPLTPEMDKQLIEEGVLPP